MSTLKTDPEVLKPAIFEQVTEIEGWFTYKNAGILNNDSPVPGLNIGFNTRSKEKTVRKNRSLLYSSLDIDPDWIALADQVHGTRVQTVAEGGVYGETDGLVTAVPGLALGIQVADCAAILLADPDNLVAAAVHAGWRGAAGNIVREAVEAIINAGGEPVNLLAYISPCISVKNFEVGEEVAELFPDRFVDRKHFEKPHIDLKKFLRHELSRFGVKEKNIEVSDGCTVDESDRFYSYRREKERSGRMAGLIRIVR